MTRHLAAAALLGLLAATPAMAQPVAAPVSAQQRDAMVERRIATLRSSLKITPAEQKPFDDFAQVMRDNAHDIAGQLQKHTQSAKAGSAVEQMQSYADLAQLHAQQAARLVPAFSTLYDALSPEQKKAADTSFRQFAAAQGARGS